MRNAAVMTLSILAAGVLTPAAAQSVATFHSAVDLVPISAIVRDGRGRLVTTLGAEDFEVFDKGERRRIIDFQLDRSGPLTIAVLLDVSGSMQIGPRLALAGDVLRQLSAGLRPGVDEMALFTFDAALHEQQAFTRLPVDVTRAIAGAHPFGTTSLYDAIAETARQLGAHAAPRRAIVVLTDGVDTSSRLTPPQVSALASSIDVPVYVAVAAQPIDRAQFVDRVESGSSRATADLRDLAQWTGGDLFWVDTTGGAARGAADLLSELRQEYLIAIESSGTPEWRPLDVRVRNRRVTVRTRSGYFVRDAPSSR